MTHNLHILIKSTYDKDINDNYILKKVYEELANIPIRRNILWNDQKIDTLIYWKKEQLNDIERHFMGDLFTTSIHNDSLQYKLTKIALREIENNIKKTMTNTQWKIIFHISKLLDI